jgi:hypothetical protein
MRSHDRLGTALIAVALLLGGTGSAAQSQAKSAVEGIRMS